MDPQSYEFLMAWCTRMNRETSAVCWENGEVDIVAMRKSGFRQYHLSRLADMYLGPLPGSKGTAFFLGKYKPSVDMQRCLRFGIVA